MPYFNFQNSSHSYGLPPTVDVAIIGAGAAGVFAACRLTESAPETSVVLLEASHQPLAKVRISGGGRCNVTHACFDLRDLLTYYPRGGKWLRGPLGQFGPQDTVNWFLRQGVPLKTERDGRMFPTTDSSQTIVDCLMRPVLSAQNITLHTHTRLERLAWTGSEWLLTTACQGRPATLAAQSVLLASGSNPQVVRLLNGLGQPVISPVPSLFTFKVNAPWLTALSGVSVSQADISLPGLKGVAPQQGPVLITHWGLSGPATLKLSAWAAHELSACQYQTVVAVDWLPHLTWETLRQQLQAGKAQHPTRCTVNYPIEGIPRQLWRALIHQAGINDDTQWAHVSKSQLHQLLTVLKRLELPLTGKGVFKDEFVTAGGVDLKGVDNRTMASKHLPNLYFAGELLDVDGVTGGFNFQNAWATGWVAANALTA